MSDLEYHVVPFTHLYENFATIPITKNDAGYNVIGAFSYNLNTKSSYILNAHYVGTKLLYFKITNRNYTKIYLASLN